MGGKQTTKDDGIPALVTVCYPKSLLILGQDMDMEHGALAVAEARAHAQDI